jgi:hypothetical protein
MERNWALIEVMQGRSEAPVAAQMQRLIANWVDKGSGDGKYIPHNGNDRASGTRIAKYTVSTTMCKGEGE